MNITDGSFLTQLLDTFRTQCTAGSATLLPDAMAIIFFLGVIEIAVFGIFNTGSGHESLFGVAKKLLRIGMFVWLVKNWTAGMNLCGQVFQSLQMVGIKASGQTIGETDPSAIGEIGIYLIKQVLNNIVSSGMSGALGVMGNLGVIVLKIVIMLCIVFCVFYMAIQLFLTGVEFYILSAISVILVPWGINKQLGFLSEKAIGAVFSISIKMMVLEFILCIAVPLMQKWGQIAGDGDPATLLHALLGCAAIAFLCWQAPSVASSLLSGSPSLNFGSGGADSMVMNAATSAPSAAMRGAGAAFQATRATNGVQSMASFSQNLKTAVMQTSSFGQGRQNMKSLIQNASQINSNNTDYNAFKNNKK